LLGTIISISQIRGDFLVIGYALLLVLPVAMAFAAANDLFTMKIPNRISMTLAAAFAASAIYLRLPVEQVLTYTGIGALFLACGFAMFSLHLLGGGDAKLMAAGALWMGPEQALTYLVYVTIFGGVLSLAILAYRNLVSGPLPMMPEWAVKLHAKGTGIPYGIAIAASALVVYPQTIWYQAWMA
jgi:prepilin peptidase CpaA